MKITEENFVEELSRGNEEALSYVMDAYGGLVKSVAARYLSALPPYQEECVNDVFFAVWNHIGSYRPERSSFANWIAGIARLKSLDYKRKYARQLLETSWDGSDSCQTAEAYELQCAFDREFSEETEQMLSCLKPEDRELFVKLYVEEKSFDEASEELHQEKSVLYNRLSRSKKRLRRLFPGGRGGGSGKGPAVSTVSPHIFRQ